MFHADTRYSFTAQFLVGAAIFANKAQAIEERDPDSVTDLDRTEHRAYVVGAVLQSAAAIDSESAEVIIHGPGHHLGSGGIDITARDFLLPLADLIDRERPHRRYNLILHLLHRPKLDNGAKTSQHTGLLMDLRNELVHYKSRWGANMSDPKTLSSRLERLKLEKPPFQSANTNFFPHRCLSASLASWAVQTSVGLINAFYTNLGITSPLEPHAERLSVLPPQRIENSR